MAENWIQSMNRCAGPALCTCSITAPHQPGNTACPRNRQVCAYARTNGGACWREGIAVVNCNCHDHPSIVAASGVQEVPRG